MGSFLFAQLLVFLKNCLKGSVGIITLVLFDGTLGVEGGWDRFSDQRSFYPYKHMGL